MTEPREIEITKTGDDKCDIRLEIDDEKAMELLEMVETTFEAWERKHYPEAIDDDDFDYSNCGEREIAEITATLIQLFHSAGYGDAGGEKVREVSHNDAVADHLGGYPPVALVAWDEIAGQPITAEPADKPSK